ncbi:MAG: hydrolase [Chthoniobacterales bacterium]
MNNFDPETTALVLIDLQNGIVSRPAEPRSGQHVVATSSKLAARFRTAGALVILVNVSFAKDLGDALKQPVDKPNPRPPGGFPEGWDVLAEGLAQPGDIRITKHQWGAFFGTDLDLQLRRRGIKTIILGGIATNMGVESTARQAYEHGYAVVLVEDAMAGLAAEMHTFAIEKIFPMMGRVMKSEEVELRKS